MSPEFRLKPTISVEMNGITPVISVTLEDVTSSKLVDERIAKLDKIKFELESAVLAVDTLKQDAVKTQAEAKSLQELVGGLRRDKESFEQMLKVPEDSLARILSKAAKKGRIRGIVEGLIIGLSTGVLSSLFVWWLTKE